MSNLIAIRKRINSIASTIRVTKVMQMIATAKIAKIKQMMTVVGRYGEETDAILQKYMHNTTMPGELKKYFSGFSKKKNVLLLLFSSDKGTCGSINTNIFKEAMHEIAEYKKNGNTVEVLPVGKKAVKWVQTNCEKLGFKVYKQGAYADAEYCDAKIVGGAVNTILAAYSSGEFSEVSILSHKFKNIITCNAVKEQILPIQNVAQDSSKSEFINIDETDSMPQAMIEFYIRTKIYNIYVSNIASIVSSRMNAMDNATKNGQEIIDDLKIKYNKSRQAGITAELSDIVSGFEAVN